MAKAHNIVVSPRPPEAGEEGWWIRAFCIIFDPVVSTAFGKEVIIRETEHGPNVGRKSAITEAMQNSFLTFSTSRTGSSRSDIPVMEQIYGRYSIVKRNNLNNYSSVINNKQMYGKILLFFLINMGR